MTNPDITSVVVYMPKPLHKQLRWRAFSVEQSQSAFVRQLITMGMAITDLSLAEYIRRCQTDTSKTPFEHWQELFEVTLSEPIADRHD